MMLNYFKKAKENFINYARPDSILIYQMGKVGSSSLEAGIKGSLHLHTLFDNSPCYVGENQRRPGIKGRIVRGIQYSIRRLALKCRRKVKIITVVRDPVDRNVSMFFQELAYWIVAYINKNDPDMRYINEGFLYDVYQDSFDHDYCLKWFDYEIKRLTGIDVMDQGFDVAKGYSIYQKGRYELLCLRAEDIPRLKSIINDFCDGNYSDVRVNDSAGKWYRSVYKEFSINMDQVKRMPESMKVMKSDMAKIFGYYND